MSEEKRYRARRSLPRGTKGKARARATKVAPAVSLIPSPAAAHPLLPRVGMKKGHGDFCIPPRCPVISAVKIFRDFSLAGRNKVRRVVLREFDCLEMMSLQLEGEEGIRGIELTASCVA